MFDSAQDLFDVVSIKVLFEAAVAAIVRCELAAVIADALFDLAVLERQIHTADALIRGGAVAFDDDEHLSARIVNNCEYPESVVGSLMPVDMHRCETVLSLITDPVFLALITHGFAFGKAQLDENVVDAIMPDVHVVIALDKTLKRACTHAILLVRRAYERTFTISDGRLWSPIVWTNPGQFSRREILIPDLIYSLLGDARNLASLIL